MNVLDYVQENYVDNGLIRYLVNGNKYDDFSHQSAVLAFEREKPKFRGVFSILNKPSNLISKILNHSDQRYVGAAFTSNIKRMIQANINIIKTDVVNEGMLRYKADSVEDLRAKALADQNMVLVSAIDGDVRSILDSVPATTLKTITDMAYKEALSVVL